MNNKKVGGLIVLMSVILLAVFIILIQALQQEAQEMGCFENAGCRQIESSLSVVHFAFGVFGFLFALGFYLIFFSRGEEAIVRRLEEDTTKKVIDDKFGILLKGLDDYERKVMKVVKNEEGITQHTLRLRTDMSKAKLSQVLGDLEKKGLIARERNRKTLAVYLKDKF